MLSSSHTQYSAVLGNNYWSGESFLRYLRKHTLVNVAELTCSSSASLPPRESTGPFPCVRDPPCPALATPAPWPTARHLWAAAFSALRLPPIAALAWYH